MCSGPAGQRRDHVARGHVAAHDGAARPVGEHAAHDAFRGVRCRGRRGGHRCGVAVRCGDRRRLSGHQAGILPAHRPQHPNCCCWRSRTSAGARSRGRFVVRRGPHRKACRPGLVAIPGHRGARGFTVARDHIAAQIEQVRAERSADIAHRRTAITGVNEFPNLSEPPLPRDAIPAAVSSATPRPSRCCATAPMRTWSAAGRGRGAAAAVGAAGRAQHPHHLRREPAGLGRNRGGQPGYRDGLGRRRSGREAAAGSR